MATAVLLQSLADGVIINQTGRPLNGHQVFVYARGTTTQVTVYSDSALTQPLTQPLTSGSWVVPGSGQTAPAAGSLPGYVASGTAIDLFDVTAGVAAGNPQGVRSPADPLAVADVIGTDGRVGGSGSVGITLTRAIGTLVYGVTVTPDCKNGPWQTVTVTNGTGFTIAAPANAPSSTQTQALAIEVSNTSGGAMGTITWNAAFVFAGVTWANPANNKHRFARFEWNGTSWICTSFSTADY